MTAARPVPEVDGLDNIESDRTTPPPSRQYMTKSCSVGCAPHLPLQHNQPYSTLAPMPKSKKRVKREVRRVRRTSAWVLSQGRTDKECRVMDISKNGAKVVVETPSEVPMRFELAFSQDGQIRRACEVIWRRGKMLGVRFL